MANIVRLAARSTILAVVAGGTIGTLIHNDYNAQQWFGLAVSGLTMGSIYALLSLGYTLVYGVLRLINLAHGDLMMTGAFSAFFVADSFGRSGFIDRNPCLGLAAIFGVAMLTAALLALLIEKVAYRPFRHVSGVAPLVCAIGISVFLQQTYRGMFGAGVRAYPDPSWLEGAFYLFNFSILKTELLVLAAALFAMASLFFLVHNTRMGLAMRAASEDLDATALMGIDVNKVVVFTFAVGGCMAGIAGVFYSLVYNQIFFMMGFLPGVKAFAAAVLGGIGSIPGAMFGGLLLGFFESVGPILFFDGLGIKSPYQLRDLVAFVLLIMVLIFRPKGIFQERLSKRA